jgi:hypothetical protein
VAAIILVLSVGARAQQAHIIHQSNIVTFNAPGAGAGANQGTFGYGINSQGVIAGFYLDAKNVYHGFLRTSSGSLTEFDAPGAGHVAGSFQGTYALGINSQEAITGFYRDANYLHHGYVRSSGGTITTFDAPGAGTRAYQGTFAYGINSQGTVAGFYLDQNDLYHGYLRMANGAFATFDAPGAGNVLHSDQGTLTGLFSDLNEWGTIAGFYLDNNNVYHGYSRTSAGAFTIFEAPGANTSAGYHGTVAASINDSGQIAGYYTDAHTVYHGFLRGSNGSFVTFDAPGAGRNANQGTIPTNIDDLGGITGYLVSASGVYNGFVRAANGSFITFNVAGAGTRAGQGTLPAGNNSTVHATTGYYTDGRNVNHGFVRTW